MSRAGLRPGDVVELVVEKAIPRGLGLSHHESQVVFVPRGVVGDRVRARIASVGRGYARATVLEWLERSRDQRASPCGYAESCGGCAYQELSYPAQLQLKEAVLRESLARAGVAWSGPLPVKPSPECGWRSRARLHFEVRGGTLRLGLRHEGSHEVVDLPRCLQLSESMNTAARALRQALQGQSALWPRLAGLTLAEGSASGLVAMLEVAMEVPAATRLGSLREATPHLTGLAALAGRREREQFLLLHGTAEVTNRVNGLQLTSHVRAFFQANRFLVEALADHVVALVPAGGGEVLDLYAGGGLFGLSLAAPGRRIRGVESDPTAVDDAAKNIRRAGLEAVSVEAGDVRTALASWARGAAEHIVLDPPRTGAGREVVAAALARAPASVVYVSCDPPTLARDLAFFSRGGYALDALSAFDMFPDTFHLEVVARLRSAEAARQDSSGEVGTVE